jgi:hypothetical protein
MTNKPQFNKQIRNQELDSLRKKLKEYIATNNKFNLRRLSRILHKNDAYLQQYLYRGTPKVLPEEDRYKLSIELNLNINEFTPEWLQNKNDSGDDQNIFIPNISSDPKNDLRKISFSRAILKGVNLTQIQNIFFYQTFLDTNTVVTNLVDVSIKVFIDENLYLLIDKGIYYLTHVKINEKDHQKIIVKPFEKKFSSFHIYKNQLNIYGKVLWQGSTL